MDIKLTRFVWRSKSSNGSSNGTYPAAEAQKPTQGPETRVSRRELRQLKWLTALVPGTVVLIYESARQEALEHILPALPVQYGNLIVWALVLFTLFHLVIFVILLTVPK